MKRYKPVINFVCVPHKPSKFYSSFTAGTSADVAFLFGILLVIFNRVIFQQAKAAE